MLKEVEDVECEINKQLDTAIKNDNVSYKNSCIPPDSPFWGFFCVFLPTFISFLAYFTLIFNDFL